MLKATEIVIEQLLIGIIFLVILVMFLFKNPVIYLSEFSGDLGNFVFTVLIVILAYACGIVVDRWSDTILDDYYHLERLKVAVQGLSYDDLSTATKDDIFPEDKIRIDILKKGENSADYHDYLRTRIRITRSVTCLLPAFFTASLLTNCSAAATVKYPFGIGTIIVYALVLFYQRYKWWHLPKTHEIEKLMFFLIKSIPTGHSYCSAIKIKKYYKYIFVPTAAWFVYIASIGLAVVYLGLIKSGNQWIWAYLPLSAIATILTGQVWLRISNTFFSFIKDFDMFAK